MEPVEFSFWGPRRCYHSCQSLTLRALVSNTKMTGKLGVLNLFLDVGVVREKVLLTLLRYRVESEKYLGSLTSWSVGRIWARGMIYLLTRHPTVQASSLLSLCHSTLCRLSVINENVIMYDKSALLIKFKLPSCEVELVVW